MVSKKGDGHVDWIISIGIFLVFLLGIFVIFKPGVQPAYDYDSLLDILEEHIKEDVHVKTQGNPPVLEDFGGLYWTLYKVPLFFQEFNDPNNEFPDKSCIKINFPYGNNPNTLEGINVYKIDDDGTRKPLNIKLSGNDLSIQETNGGSWNPNNKYIIYFSDNSVYNIEESKPIAEGIACVSETNMNYNLGIVETTTGISENAIDILSGAGEEIANQNYEQLKTIYGYPSSKEFSFTVIQSEGSNLEYVPKQPDVKVNIYTRSWGDFILNTDGTRKPVTLNIRIW